MTHGRIGVAVAAPTPAAALAQIIRLEEAGVPAAWLTTGGARPDGLTLLAAAAARTQRILLGTSIVPILPRHPIAVVQQAQVVASLAPGRFRLGLGPSHRPTMESAFGLSLAAPLARLREYLTIVRTLLHTGAVDVDGQFYRAHARIDQPVDVPVMASALRPASYHLLGEVADGAISWVSPGAYLRDVALPALRQGAARAGRPAPPLIAHAPVCVHEDGDQVVAAAQEHLGGYPRLPFYAKMFEAAGYPEATQGTWSRRMVDAVVLWGNEATVRARLEELFSWGIGEVIITLMGAGPNRQAAWERSLKLVAAAAAAV